MFLKVARNKDCSFIELIHPPNQMVNQISSILLISGRTESNNSGRMSRVRKQKAILFNLLLFSPKPARDSEIGMTIKYKSIVTALRVESH